MGEHRAALNPVAFTESVVDDFLRYQLTTYPLADQDLYGQMRGLLSLSDRRRSPLRQGPYISLSRPFKQGASVSSLVSEGVFHAGMQTVVPYPHLRAHQEDAIRHIHAGRTTLVSTGTGSGKTECFLYPIISRCLEMQAMGSPAGVTAVIFYPMNALAEDQLIRLRGLLAGRGVTFGMYVGKTPDTEAGVFGRRVKKGSSNADYHALLRKMREEGSSEPLIPTEERASREAIRRDPPRILLTNVKQLELLLTRSRDLVLFQGAPLEFLVFDEAHTFRGAQGAETACLIRRLRTFCGRTPEQTTCVATSATMADAERGLEAGRDFAHRFFGVSRDRVSLVGEVYAEQDWPQLLAPPFEAPDDPNGTLQAILSAVDLPDSEVGAALTAACAPLVGPLPEAGWATALHQALQGNRLLYELFCTLKQPCALDDLPGRLEPLVGRRLSQAELLCWLALSVACGRGGQDPLLRPVIHSFVRGVGGAVVTFSEPGDHARLWLSGEDATAELGAEHFYRFPLLSCTTCGQHYYTHAWSDLDLTSKVPGGGEQVGKRRCWSPLAEENGGLRGLLVDRLVVTQDEDEEDGDTDDDAVPSGSVHIQHRRLVGLWLCRQCGALHDAQGACGACGATEALVAIHVVRQNEKHPGELHSCVACQAPARYVQGRYREPARQVRAIGVSDVHILAQSMLHLSEKSGRPRLLIFADNRQDAAFQAGWMRDHARRFRLRALMYGEIPEKGAAIGDLTAALDGLMENDRELSRALLPEVWQVVSEEDAGTKHREERAYFLRLQILRELATGVKQRLGLEPWGRMRVEYVGLDGSRPFFQHWSDRLRCTPEALVEGVAAILDHHRRLRLLHDESSQVFGKLWRSGDLEIQRGYIPDFGGGPRAIKLSREEGDSQSRLTQWIGQRPTQLWNAVLTWGLGEPDVATFLQELWVELVRLDLLVPVTLLFKNNALQGTQGAHQINGGKLRITRSEGRWRCQKCRRVTVRSGPTQVCMAWRCGGPLRREEDDPDDFDLRMLDESYAMLRVAEHSGQVPHRRREIIENQFKGDGEQLNTLVCTPTLELGVDIGALDTVLMRNVPPTAANYWQRAGRAGRRHRMAVDITYAQATSFDQAYFREPLKLLGGLVEPPRFNLKNALMIRKHVHATVLTTLHRMAIAGPLSERMRIAATLQECFPRQLRGYLFDAAGKVLPQARSVQSLTATIRRHRTDILAEVQQAFTTAWPVDDAAAVAPVVLEGLVDGMGDALQEVIARLKKRLDWARQQLARLQQVELEKGILDPEDQAHRRRCERLIARLKATGFRTKRDAEGGASDAETMGVLAREGFLPGYGLETGSIIGYAEPPRLSQGLSAFELSRAPALALREYVPGNAIYANGYRFVPRFFQLSPDAPLRYRLDISSESLQELGENQAAGALQSHELRAVPICDVNLPSESQIADTEEFRFQMPVATYGNDRGFHRGGVAYKSGKTEIHFRRGVQVRLLNVGPRGQVAQQLPGYRICLACGASMSPYSSKQAKQDFDNHHAERCRHKVEPTGFYADVEVDALTFRAMPGRKEAFSLGEALRMGAARVLDMEVEDLQLLAISQPGSQETDILLYDPMPGGSGLLEELCKRWEAVIEASRELVQHCRGGCETSCIDCLRTYRNRFYHGHLDRKVADDLLEKSAHLNETHPIPEHLPTTLTVTGKPQTWLEDRFRLLLLAAGLGAPQAQKKITLPGNMYTIPDFFYDIDDEDEPGLCIYLDGMAGHIHGNPAQQQQDSLLRSTLRSQDYEVIEIPSSDIYDPPAIQGHIQRIAKKLIGKDHSKKLKNDASWYDSAPMPPETPGGTTETGSGGPAPVEVPIFTLPQALEDFAAGRPPTATGMWPLAAQDDRPGLFAARLFGEAMNPEIPSGALCLWEHLGGDSPAVAGEILLTQRPSGVDAILGPFVCGRLEEQGGRWFLVPSAGGPQHSRLPLTGGPTQGRLARLVEVLSDEVDPEWTLLKQEVPEAVHALLDALYRLGAPLPDFDVEFNEDDRVSDQRLTLGWAERRVGISAEEDVSLAKLDVLRSQGWKIFNALTAPTEILATLIRRM